MRFSTRALVVESAGTSHKLELAAIYGKSIMRSDIIEIASELLVLVIKKKLSYACYFRETSEILES